LNFDKNMKMHYYMVVLFCELKTNLKNGVAPGYILSGSDVFLINKSIELILETAGIDSMSILRLDDEVKQDKINLHLQNVSMFGSGNAVIVREPDKTKIYLKPVKADKELEKIDCKPMEEDLVVRMIMQNKKFPNHSAVMLARLCENNFSAVSNEMEKLIAYHMNKETIEPADINEMVNKTEKFQIYELSNIILKRDPMAIQKVLQSLFDNGVEEYAIFGSLLSFARKMFYAKNSQLRDGDLAKVLDVHPYGITSLRRDSRHIDNLQATEIYDYALSLEHQIKSGKVLAERAIMMLTKVML